MEARTETTQIKALCAHPDSEYRGFISQGRPALPVPLAFTERIFKMGTRADFYIGKGKDAKWLGSIAWDGYEFAKNPKTPIAKAKTEEEFLAAVAELSKRDDFTKPEDGWPWPWADSQLTDYAYYFENGKVQWDDRHDWPDMSNVKNVQLGGVKSGLIVLGK